MNELLQQHGCSNVFNLPDGLRELMADISREVLRKQPVKIYDFIANYLSVLLVTREHGILAVKILEDLCDCRPSVSEHLMQLGMCKEDADIAALIIKKEIEKTEVTHQGKETLKEAEVIKKILKKLAIDEEMSAKVCEITRNAFRDYWYRKKLLEQSLKAPLESNQPWEIAVQRTLEVYKKTRPTFSEMTRATQKIQAAYKGYYTRKKMLKHLKKKKKQAPKVDLPGPPLDIAVSREVDLGRVVEVKVKKEDNVAKMFADDDAKSLGLSYDTAKTITNVGEPDEEPKPKPKPVAIYAPEKPKVEPHQPYQPPTRPSLRIVETKVETPEKAIVPVEKLPTPSPSPEEGAAAQPEPEIQVLAEALKHETFVQATGTESREEVPESVSVTPAVSSAPTTGPPEVPESVSVTPAVSSAPTTGPPSEVDDMADAQDTTDGEAENITDTSQEGG